MQVDLNGRAFHPVENAAAGTVSGDTRFHFSQDGLTISATYHGGTISRGHILGQFTDTDHAELIYHCLTTDGSLKAGKAVARFSKMTDGRLQIDMDWQWLDGGGQGSSRYEEIT